MAVMGLRWLRGECKQDVLPGLDVGSCESLRYGGVRVVGGGRSCHVFFVFVFGHLCGLKWEEKGGRGCSSCSSSE